MRILKVDHIAGLGGSVFKSMIYISFHYLAKPDFLVTDGFSKNMEQGNRKNAMPLWYCDLVDKCKTKITIMSNF